MPPRKGKPASVDAAFRKWLSDRPTEQLECRIFGHQWPGVTELSEKDRIGRRTGGQYVLEMYCHRGCDVQRRSYLTSSFFPAPTGNTYTYPPGYQLPEAEGGGWYFDKARRAAVRGELIRRASEIRPIKTVTEPVKKPAAKKPRS
jgi:hypothetical protein